jgi:hypothetical protein
LEATFLLAAWTAALCAWCLGIGEFLGLWLFRPWAFGAGVRVLKKKLLISLSNLPVGQVMRTQSGALKLAAPGVCLLRPRFTWSSLRYNTPFPIKARLIKRADHVEVDARVPLFPSVFMGAWLVLWSAATVIGLRSGRQPLIHLAFGLAGWVFAGAMVTLSVRFELRRFARLLHEVEQVAGAARSTW